MNIFTILSIISAVVFIPLYILSDFYICPLYNVSSLISIIIFHIFHISNSTFFKLFILLIFLIFSHFIFSTVPIFLIFSHFRPRSFHTFNFSNSHFLSHSLTNSFSPILSFHFSLSILHSTSRYNFPKFPQQNKFCFTLKYSLHFTSQLYTFFPLYPFFNLLPALDILSLQCPVRGLVPSLPNSSSSI